MMPSASRARVSAWKRASPRAGSSRSEPATSCRNSMITPLS